MSRLDDIARDYEESKGYGGTFDDYTLSGEDVAYLLRVARAAERIVDGVDRRKGMTGLADGLVALRSALEDKGTP